MKTVEKFLSQRKAGKKSALVILGPTASGKTALSIELAKRFNGEIISADSRQVYRYMDIGTDKIPLEKRGGIPHYLIDVVNPDERFTVVDFKKQAEEKIEEILAAGRLPIVVGGTGLYLRTLTENFQIPGTGDDLSLRKELEKEALARAKQECGDNAPLEAIEERATALLHEKLKAVDPDSTKKIHPRNRRYILRALEIFYLTGKPKREDQAHRKYDILKLGLCPPKEVLDERIARRVDEQFERGLVEEVKMLLRRGFHENLPALQTIGYRELISTFHGKISLPEAKEQIKIHTRQFARRQMIWFRREKDITWRSGVGED